MKEEEMVVETMDLVVSEEAPEISTEDPIETHPNGRRRISRDNKRI